MVDGSGANIPHFSSDECMKMAKKSRLGIANIRGKIDN